MKLFILSLVLMLPGVARAEPPHTDYEVVPFSSTATTLGVTGGAGDVLEKMIVAVSATTANKVFIQDGSAPSIVVFAAGAAIGTYSLNLGMRSVNGAWKVSTDTSASVIGIGRFK